MIDSVDSPYIITATTSNFKQVVLENSKKGPVLANFWSKKAGPCLRQYPVLDQLIHAYNGLLLLVNINTEVEIVITKECNVASVPTLKLYRHGQVLETLHGFQSEGDLKKIVDLVVVRKSDQVLSEAIRLYGHGKANEAYEMITTAITNDPLNPRLPLAICKLLKHEERYEEALTLLESLPPAIKDYYEIKPLLSLISFLVLFDSTADIASLSEQLESTRDDLAVKKQLSVHYVIANEPEKALILLADIMQIQPDYADRYAQKAMLNLFVLLGADNPLVKQYRSNLRRYSH